MSICLCLPFAQSTYPSLTPQRTKQKVMELLDAGSTSRFGHPRPTPIRTTPVQGKCLAVSGHDLRGAWVFRFVCSVLPQQSTEAPPPRIVPCLHIMCASVRRPRLFLPIAQIHRHMRHHSRARITVHTHKHRPGRDSGAHGRHGRQRLHPRRAAGALSCMFTCTK